MILGLLPMTILTGLRLWTLTEPDIAKEGGFSLVSGVRTLTVLLESF
jgi:hypothetical protein